MKKRLKTMLLDNIKTDVASQGKQLSSCLIFKIRQSFRINKIFFTMMNVLKIIVTMAMQQDGKKHI